MAKIKVSELEQLDEKYVNEDTSLLAVDSQQSYQLRYGFLSSNLSSSLYQPLTRSVANAVCAEFGIQQQKDDIAALKTSCNELSNASKQLTDTKVSKTDIASNSTPGLIKLGFTSSSQFKDYPVKLDAENRAYVNVPWEGGGEDAAKIASYVYELCGITTEQPTTYFNTLQDNVQEISSYQHELSTTFGQMPANYFNNLQTNLQNLLSVGIISSDEEQEILSNQSKTFRIKLLEQDELSSIVPMSIVGISSLVDEDKLDIQWQRIQDNYALINVYNSSDTTAKFKANMNTVVYNLPKYYVPELAE